MPPTLHGGADALVRSRVQHPTFNHIWDGTVTGTGISIKGQKRAAARAVMPTTRFFFFSLFSSAPHSMTNLGRQFKYNINSFGLHHW